ncbi:MAG: glycosyltransferase family 2 protein [Candidatus Komeilibacteria bacterium]|nr:glycosyltransferase family 2 protein [Candidatus Komeilibacteria bacterium]
MSTNRFHKVTVQLVTHNSEKFLPFLLSSLAAQTYAAFDVLILDNASTDQTVRFLREHYPRFQLITSQKNLGFAKAHNQMFGWHKAEYILFLNHDLILDKNYLAQAVALLDSQPQVAAVGGKLLRWDYETNEKTNVLDSAGLTVYKNHRVIDRGAGEEDQKQYNTPGEVFGVSGALFLARRSALEAVRLPQGTGFEYFDQDFISYKEDVDLMYRFRLAGWQVYYLPSSLAWHERALKPADNLRLNRQNRSQLFNRYSYRNHLAVILKNEFWGNLWRQALHIFWYEFKKIGWLLIFEQKTLGGLKDFFRQLPTWLKKRNYIKNNIKKITSQELAKWYK